MDNVAGRSGVVQPGSPKFMLVQPMRHAIPTGVALSHLVVGDPVLNH